MDDQAARPFIEFTGVTKRFGSKVVYRGLDFSLARGEVFTVVGGSGVGKSVMLKMLIGLLKADGGSIVFDGADITKMDERQLSVVRQRIAMLFQSAALFDSLSVGDNVRYGLEEHFHTKMSRGEQNDRVAWALGLVGLPGIEDIVAGRPLGRYAQARGSSPRHRSKGPRWCSTTNRRRASTPSTRLASIT